MTKDERPKQNGGEQKRIDNFLEKLARLDNGERAQLKRSAGSTLAEAKFMFGFYQKVLPYGTPKWQEDHYFLVATLYAFDRLQREKDQATQGRDQGEEEAEVTAASSIGNLGDSLRLARIRQEQNAPGFDRQMLRLLDADWAELPFHLRRAIVRLTTERVPINWQQLTRDVLHWDRPGRYVQKEWARAYVAPAPQSESTSETQ